MEASHKRSSMTKEEIIRMAREAGFVVDWQHADVAEIKAKRYEHFASLVAEHEREACAKVCEQEVCACCWEDDAQAAAEHLAERIRARGER
jgi:hypothetical protein